MNDQAVRAGQDGAGEQADADVEAIQAAGEVEPEIHGAEEVADRVFGHPVVAGPGVDEEHLLLDVHVFLAGLVRYLAGLGMGAAICITARQRPSRRA